MNCDEMLELISGHVDGENTEAQERQLQKHLESCAECRALLQAYEQIDTGLLELTEEPPERLAQGVMYRIGLEKKGQKRFAFGRWTALGAAAVLALMLAGGALTRRIRRRTQRRRLHLGIIRKRMTQHRASVQNRNRLPAKKRRKRQVLSFWRRRSVKRRR